jgi:hypothetical protein
MAPTKAKKKPVTRTGRERWRELDDLLRADAESGQGKYGRALSEIESSLSRVGFDGMPINDAVEIAADELKGLRSEVVRLRARLAKVDCGVGEVRP